MGAGAMGRNHARVLGELAGAELVGVVDADRRAAEKVLPGGAFTDLGPALAASRPEAVVVAVPTAGHHRVTLEAIEAGCAVLVEKPIAASLEEAAEMVDAAERARVVLAVGHVERYNPALIELKRRVEEGELGRVFQAHARRLGPFPNRVRDVGVVVDLATHDLDAMRFVIGSEITRVYAETKREIHTSREDLMSGLVRFADGTIGVVQTNWLTPTKIRDLSITGERGMFVVDYLAQDLYFYENAAGSGSGWQAMDVLRGVAEGRMVRYVVNRREPLGVELAEFLAAVRGEAGRVVTGRDGILALEAALALVESGQTGALKELSHGG